MQSYTTIIDMYQYYSFTRDPAQATEAVTTVWNQKMQALKGLPEADQQRKINKLLALADAEPSPHFGELVRSIAHGAGAPATVDSDGVLRKARMSPVLLHETAMDSLERVVDPVGRVASSLIEPFVQASRIDPPVAVRVRQRVSRALSTNGLPQRFEGLVQHLSGKCGVSTPALWRAVDWFELPMRFLDTDRMTNVLAEQANAWVAQQLPDPPELDQRTRNELKPARMLVELLAATKPEAFPVFADHPGLEEFLSGSLHREVPQIELALAALDMTKKLGHVYKAYKERGAAALDGFPWSATDPEEKQAALAYCSIGEQLEVWEQGLLPQMEQVVHEETQALWSHRLTRDPGDLNALRRRALSWLSQNNAVEALQDLSRAAELQPNAANLRDHAVLLGNAGRYAEAEEQVNRALGCADTDPLTQGHLYTLRADLRLKLKQPLQAWGDAVRATLLAPSDPVVHQVFEVTSSAEQQAWCDALDTLELASADVVPYVRAHELMKLRRWDEASKAFAAVQAHNPDNPHVRGSAALAASLQAAQAQVVALLEANPQGRLAGDLGVASAAGDKAPAGGASVVEPKAA